MDGHKKHDPRNCFGCAIGWLMASQASTSTKLVGGMGMLFYDTPGHFCFTTTRLALIFKKLNVDIV